MEINFYDTRLTETGSVKLVKEKAVEYGAGKITCPEDAAALARGMLHMDELAEEHCYMASLNNAGRIPGLFFLSKGTAGFGIMNPREVYIRALLAGAAHIILMHNHPSGDVSPSRQDMETTGRIKEAGELVGIALSDHIIIGAGGRYLSFKETGLLDALPKK